MKKMLALVLCVLMIVGLFAGCNNDPKPTPTNPPATQGGDKPAGTTAPPTTADDGRSAAGELPIVTDGSNPTITIALCQNALTVDYETNEYTVWVEEQTGVNLEFIYLSSDSKEALTKLNLMVSGGEKLPDIIWGVTGIAMDTLNQWGRDEYLVNLQPYFDEGWGYFTNESFKFVEAMGLGYEIPNIFKNGADPVSGGLYSFPHFQTGAVDNAVSSSINIKWLENLGLEMPTNLDELYNVLVQFRDKDANGNGDPGDEIPMLVKVDGYHCNTLERLISPFVFCSDKYFFNSTDGQIWVPYVTDEYRQALIYMNKLYSEGLLSPMSFTDMSDSDVKALVTPAEGDVKVGVIGIHATLGMDNTCESIYQWDAMPIMEAEEGCETGGYASMRTNTFRYCTMVTTDCEDPLLAFRVLDFMAGEKAAIFARYGVEGRDWEYIPDNMEFYTDYGYRARLHIINSQVYTEQNNINWHNNQSVIFPSSMYANYDIDAPADNTMTPAKWRAVINGNVYKTSIAAGQPDEVVYNLLYNAEESEAIAEPKTLCNDYMLEARALFISGTMDPNSDADWQKYLDSMEANGLSIWVENTQSCWDRMNGK